MSEVAAGRGEALLAAARRALAEAVGAEPGVEPELEVDPASATGGERCAPELTEPAASFVTLVKGGELRGCIGSLDPHRPLIEDVCENARAAALEDHRFPPVEPGELGEISLEVSVLSPLEPLDAASEPELLAALEPGVDGLVLECGGKRAVFLPQVWRGVPEPARFVEQLKIKAGLAPKFWSEEVRAWRFGVEKYAE